MVTRRHGQTVPEYSEQKPGDPLLKGVAPEPWQEAVLAEERDLYDKYSRLKRFRETDTYADLSPYEKSLLGTQFHHMAGYLKVLMERIRAFQEKDYG